MTVDSSESALRPPPKGLRTSGGSGGGIVVLEPIMEVSVTVPQALFGDLLADLTRRGAEIVGTEDLGELGRITAHLSLRGLTSYEHELTAITGGQGRCEIVLNHFNRLDDEGPDLNVPHALALRA